MVILGNTNPVELGRCLKFLNNWNRFIQGTNQYSYTILLRSSENHSPKNQTEFAESYGITQQTMNNYMRMAIRTLAYNTKEEVIEWMLDIQLGRRNLSPIQRIAVAEKYRPIYEKQAQENLKEGGRRGGLVSVKKPLVNLPNPLTVENKIDVREKLASVAGVSEKTYSMGKKILDSNNEDIKQRVLSGETSISAGYKELIQKQKWRKDKYRKIEMNNKSIKYL